MAEAVLAAAVKAGEWIGMTVFQASTAAGASTATAATLAGAAQYVVTATIVLASAALAVGSVPEPPTVEGAQLNLKQSRIPRRGAYGRVRLGGSYLFWKAKGNRCFDVLYVAEGRFNAATDYWLHSDKVNVIDGVVQGLNLGNGGQRYETGRVKVETRLGLPVETAFSGPQSSFAPVFPEWTEDHRGDGMVTAATWAAAGKVEDMKWMFPFGSASLNVGWEAWLVCDWRSDGDAYDDSTWAYSENCALVIRDYLCGDYGFGFDHDEVIAPFIDQWTAAANRSDEDIPLAGGGTEKRWACSGSFDFVNAPAAVLEDMLEACDGWVGEVDGGFILRVGGFETPTVTLTDDHIEELSLVRFDKKDRVANIIEATYTSPEHHFKTQPVRAWRDAAAIEEDGKDIPIDLPLPWVLSHGQARRLCKRKMARMNAPMRGTVVVNLYGLKALGERYLRIKADHVRAEPMDIFIEVIGEPLTDDFAGTVLIPFIQVFPSIDDWSPEEEEGEPPPPLPDPEVDELDAPTITAATPFFDTLTVGGAGVRLLLEAEGLEDRDDLLWRFRWKLAAATDYSPPSANIDAGDDAEVEFPTGFVPIDATLHVQVAIVSAGGNQSDWSEPFEVSTASSGVAPAKPTDLDGEGDVGQATVSWRNPTSPNFHGSRLWRGATGSPFGSATDVSGLLTAGLGEIDSLVDTTSAGTYDYWVTAENAAGTMSLPEGPFTIVVT